MHVISPFHWFDAALLLMLSCACAGCVPNPRDVSAEPRIRDAAIIGRELRLAEDFSLLELGRPYPRLVLAAGPVQKSMGGPGQVRGLVEAGTRVRITKVERAVYYDDGLFRAERDL